MGTQIDLEDLANEMINEGKKTAFYVRVSSEGQNVDRQIVPNSISFIDVCSGSTAFKTRKQASKLLKRIDAGEFNQVQVHSIDRLGRNTIDIMQTIEMLTSKGVNVISAKEGLQTIVDGKINPVAKLMIGILGTLAEFELNRIRERTQEGREKGKKRNAFKGRVKGSGETDDVFFSKKKVQDIQKHLKNGESLLRTSKLAGASLNLVRKVRDKTQNKAV